MKKKINFLLLFFVVLYSHAQKTTLLRNASLLLPERGNMEVNWVLPPVEDSMMYSLPDETLDKRSFAVDSNGWPLLSYNKQQVLQPRRQLGYLLSQPFNDVVITTAGALFFTTDNDWGFADFQAAPVVKDGLPLVPFQPIASLPVPGSRMMKGTRNSLYFYGTNTATGLTEVFLLQPQPAATGTRLSGFRKVFETREVVTAVTGNGSQSYIALGKALLILNHKDSSVVQHPARFLGDITQLLLSEEAGLFYVSLFSIGHVGAQEAKDFFFSGSGLSADLQGNTLYIFFHRNLGVLSISHQEEWQQRTASFSKVQQLPAADLTVKELAFYEAGKPAAGAASKPSRSFQRQPAEQIMLGVKLQNKNTTTRQLYNLQLTIVGPDGAMMENKSELINFKAGVSLFDYRTPMGGPSTLCNGWYKIVLTVSGSQIATDSFRVTGPVNDLFTAIDCNDTTTAAILLGKGADPNGATPDSITTLLQLAVARGQEAMVQLLLSKGAWAELADPNGQTALFAWRFNPEHTRILQLLLDKGVPVNHKDLDGNTALAVMLEQMRYFNSAQRQLLFNGARLLLSKGANLNIRNTDGNTPLNQLAGVTDQPGNLLPVAQWLLENGADPNLADTAGEAPLYKIVKGSLNPQWVQLLLKHGASVQIKQPNSLLSVIFSRSAKWKPLRPERVYEAFGVARMLLDAKAPFMKSDEDSLLSNGFWQWLTANEMEALLNRRPDLRERAMKLPHPAIQAYFCRFYLQQAKDKLKSAVSNADYTNVLQLSRNAYAFLQQTFQEYVVAFVPGSVPERYRSDSGFTNKNCYLGISYALLTNFQCRVSEIQNDSPLKDLLQPLDIIVAMNGTPLTKEQTITTIKDNMQTGRESSMVIRKEGELVLPEVYLLNGMMELRIGNYAYGKQLLQRYLLCLQPGEQTTKQQQQIQALLEQYKSRQ
jgi:ankyrin repeat protein